MYVIEAILVLIAVALSMTIPRLAEPLFVSLEQWVRSIASRPRLAVLIATGFALVLRAVLLPVEPVPQPATHDEFSYWLAADTFAHGRVTNPTHPMWVHFETFHVIQKPTYASMYYPAQGLLLAFGRVVFGHPFWGVWLSIGLFCGALCWCLEGFVPLGWALMGAVMAAIRLGSFSYWANSYWGGNLAAIGGALALGAVPRLKDNPRSQYAIVMGAGFALLAITRPYESLFFCAALLLFLLAMWWRSESRTKWLKSVALPFGLILVATSLGMMYYFWRVTGNPLRTPFMVNLATYNAIPYFPWQRVTTPPAYNHAVMRDFYIQWWLGAYELGRSNPVLLASLKAASFWLFFIAPVFSLPLVFAPFLLPYGLSYRMVSWKAWLLLATSGATIIGLLLPVYFNPHYAAPMTAALYALIMLALLRIRRWRWRSKQTGIFLSRVIPLICGLMLVVRAFAPQLHVRIPPQIPPRWCSRETYPFARAEVFAQLAQNPGGQLAVVRYRDEHYLHREWVFNDADIDHAKVVWARDMGSRNEELLRYFRDREAWLVEPDEIPPRVTPYPKLEEQKSSVSEQSLGPQGTR